MKTNKPTKNNDTPKEPLYSKYSGCQREDGGYMAPL